MSETYAPISLHRLTKDPDLTFPASSKHLSKESPAIEVMTDFNDVAPVTVAESSKIDDALNLMKNQHVRLLVVVNPEKKVSGIISAADILGAKTMVYAQTHSITRELIEVKDLMERRDAVQALRFEQILHAKVGHIMNTLKSAGEQHLLITEEDDKTSRIRGIVSASDISRKLKISFDAVYSAKNLAELEQTINPAKVAEPGQALRA